MKWYRRAIRDEYPRAPSVVDGRHVLDDIPNISSIESSLLDYEVLPGIREVPMSDLGGPKSVFYAADDFRRSSDLARQIGQSGQIKPLIIVVDRDGPYILEGAHRFVALHELGAKSFPALVVVDKAPAEPEPDKVTQAAKGDKGNLPSWMTSSIGDIARDKILNPIGLLRGETVTSTNPITVNVNGVDEEMFLVFTEGRGDPEWTSKEIVQNRSGRILASFSEDLSLGIEGGAFWVGKGGPNGSKILQSIYVDPLFRGGRLTPVLMQALGNMGVSSAMGPFSDSGRKFMERHGLEEVT